MNQDKKMIGAAIPAKELETLVADQSGFFLNPRPKSSADTRAGLSATILSM